MTRDLFPVLISEETVALSESRKPNDVLFHRFLTDHAHVIALKGELSEFWQKEMGGQIAKRTHPTTAFVVHGRELKRVHYESKKQPGSNEPIATVTMTHCNLNEFYEAYRRLVGANSSPCKLLITAPLIVNLVTHRLNLTSDVGGAPAGGEAIDKVLYEHQRVGLAATANDLRLAARSIQTDHGINIELAGPKNHLNLARVIPDQAASLPKALGRGMVVAVGSDIEYDLLDDVVRMIEEGAVPVVHASNLLEVNFPLIASTQRKRGGPIVPRGRTAGPIKNLTENTDGPTY